MAVSIKIEATQTGHKKVIFVSGPITGVKNYWEVFEKAEEMLEGLGYIALTPSRLPQGLTNAQYTRICMAMIDSADAVVFLPRWDESEGAHLEYEYCRYTHKPLVSLRTNDFLGGGAYPPEVTQSWLKHDLEEVLK